MKMIQGANGANITNYGSYISNCTLNQKPYKIPVRNLQDVQLYIDIGDLEPSAIEYELINTCVGSGIESIIPSRYVIGQDTNDNWYGVFKGFTGATPTCFVIAITLYYAGTDTEEIYFSEEYCIENACETLTLIKGCYGNLENQISYDADDIYFGTALGAGAMGDLTLVYKHEVFLRDVEVYRSAIKNIFKQGRTRNFRTEKQRIYQFNSELVPDWFLNEIDSVFYRGEVFVGSAKYLVNETAFELVDECSKTWKISATFKEGSYQSFSCEANPCQDPVIDSGEDSGTDSGGEDSGDDSGITPIGGGNVSVEECSNTNAINEIRFNDEIATVITPVIEGQTRPVEINNPGLDGTLEIDIVDYTGDIATTRIEVTDSNGNIQCQSITGNGTYSFNVVDIIDGLSFTIEVVCGGDCP